MRCIACSCDSPRPALYAAIPAFIWARLEYASDGPELSNEKIERQFAELEGKLLARPGDLEDDEPA
jgi:hypothetical protein